MYSQIDNGSTVVEKYSPTSENGYTRGRFSAAVDVIASEKSLRLLGRPQVPLAGVPLVVQQLARLLSDLVVKGDEEPIVDIDDQENTRFFIEKT